MYIVNNLSQLLDFVLPAKSFYSSEILYEKSSESSQARNRWKWNPLAEVAPAALASRLPAAASMSLHWSVKL